MNIFESLLSHVKEIHKNLMLTANSKRNRIARILGNGLNEFKSLRLKRIGHFIRCIFSYIKGNSTAMQQYNLHDPLYQAIEEISELEKQLQNKAKAFEELPANNPLAEQNSISSDEMSFLDFPVEEKGESHKPKGKRVAYFTNLLLDWNDHRPRFGGGERYCLTLSRLLQKNGFEIQIFQTAPTEFSGEYYGLPVQTIVCGEYYSEFNITAAEKFYEISLDYDYAIYNLPELSAMKMRQDAIAICHGIWFDHNNYGDFIKFRKNKWFRFLYNAFSNPRHIVSVDTNSINVIRALWPELVNKMTFIPNFVDHTLFFPPKERTNKKLTVLFPRRSQINRGSRLLESILSLVTYQDIDFYWVGEGDDYDTNLILELTKKDRRLQYKKATFDQMPDWYRKADITVIPTIACEGTSLSCIESMASGCATISTNVGGLTDIIYDEINGLSVNPTAEDIADAINRLIEDRQLLQKLQTAGLEYSFHFSIDKWEAKWLRVLSKLGWIESEKKKSVS